MSKAIIWGRLIRFSARLMSVRDIGVGIIRSYLPLQSLHNHNVTYAKTILYFFGSLHSSTSAFVPWGPTVGRLSV